MSLEPAVNQENIKAYGDVVAGNKLNLSTLNINPQTSASKISALQQALLDEMNEKKEVRILIGELQKYYTPKLPADGIIGLQRKLEFSGRQDEVEEAIEDKEAFVILLERWSLYYSAQEIILYILTKAIHDFRQHIKPILSSIDRMAQNELVTGRIIHPLVNEVGCGRFQMNAIQMMGMYYWLAEQCYVKWHA